MEIFFTILIMTLVVSLSGVVTRVLPFQVPLPLMQIAIGALLAWPTFGLHVEFDPELFLVLFIPPLLFADGWKTPTREFIEHGREILGLALALVVVTVVGIGFLIYWIVPGIPLIPAFALAAVLSPTDAVALSGIVGEGRIPKKIMGILQGEALMNDASGLVSLKFAVAVAMGTMVFTVGGATVEFLKVAIGGVLAGFVVSWSYGRSMRFLSRWGGDEPATQIVLLFLLPFMPASWLGLVITFQSYPIIQKYIINPYYEQRGEVNPELAQVSASEEETVFEDMGGKEKPIEPPKKAGGKQSGGGRTHKGKGKIIS